MKLKSFLQGVAILQKYYKDPDGYHLGSEHDQIYFYATDEKVSPEDFVTLTELGFFQPDVEPDEDDNAPYDHNEGWSCYV